MKIANKHWLVIGGLLLGVLLVWWGFRPQEPVKTALPVAPLSASASRELRFGLNIAAGSALHAAAVKFAEQVETRSKGRLKINVFPDQKLGNDDQMLEQARSGQLDLLLTPTAKLSAAIPAMQYADLPLYFENQQELYAMLDGEPGQLLLNKLAVIDLVGLSFWENGFKQFTANTPLRVPEDFRKLRIRTMKSPLIAEQFASLGAQPIPIDFHATYQALADGAVDGQENPLVAIVGMRFHEVQKHLTLSNHAYLGYVFSASKKVYETLAPDLREILQQVARDLTVWERQETARRETDFVAQIRAAGVQVAQLSPAEMQSFRHALLPLADKFGLVVGYDLLAKSEEIRFLREQPAMAGKRPWIVGLNADLSSSGAQAGGAIYRGLQLAIEEINQRGGIRGQPVRLLARDHGGNARNGLRNLEFFAAQENCVAVFGGMHSAVIAQELPMIHQQQMPYLIPWAAGITLTEHEYSPNYTYRVSISDRMVAPFLLEKAQKIGGKLAVLLERSTWGRSNEEVIQKAIAKSGQPSPEIVWFDLDDQLIEEKVQNLAKNGFGVFMMVANPTEARAIIRAVAKLPQPIPVLSHWGLTGSDFYTAMQGPLQQVDLRFVQSILVDENGHNGLSKLLQRYRARYGLSPEKPIPSPIGTVHAYDLMNLLALAIKESRGTDRPAIRDALEKLPPYKGVLREYAPAFDRHRHDALESRLLHLARFNDKGHIVSAE